MVLDKTGTITRGRPELVAVHPVDGWDPDELLTLVAAAEVGSEHPVGEAVVRGARDRGLTLPATTRFDSVPGHGVVAEVGGRTVLAGNRAHLAAYGVAAADGPGVLVAVDGRLRRPPRRRRRGQARRRPRRSRPSSARGLEVWMVTGDHEATARAVAAEVGIDHVVADVRPADKAAQVAELQAAGARGRDGRRRRQRRTRARPGRPRHRHRAPAPTSRSPPPTSRSSAGTCSGLVSAIELSRRTVTTIKQGLAWAFAYNVLLIPVAAGALHWWDGLLLDPVLASAAMAMSSVSVVTNALRLRRPSRGRVADGAYLAGHRGPGPRHRRRRSPG